MFLGHHVAAGLNAKRVTPRHTAQTAIREIFI
jgi:hypothetical protein